MGDTDKKLEAFLDIIASGEVSHAKIAELADVTVEDVAAFVARLEPELAPEPESAPSPEEPAPVPVPISEPPAEPVSREHDELGAWLAREEERLAERANQLAAWDLELSQREMVLANALAKAGVLPSEALATAAPSVDPGTAPPVVRALRKAHVIDENGRPLRVGTRDVFTGARAAHIWARYPGLVEPYSPRSE